MTTESMEQSGHLGSSDDVRRGAKRFLSGLEEHLNGNIPCPLKAVEEIEAVVKQAKASEQDRAKRGHEGAFLNHFVARPLYEFVMRELGLSAEEACSAFLSESYRSLPGIASGTPARSRKHPFTKVTKVSPGGVIARWKTHNPLTQSCPDIALRSPSPYTIVFEGKYFRKGGRQAAETALVDGIYQSFFYRGLPPLSPTRRHAGWTYEFACLMAYDASPDASLLNAWRSLPAIVKEGCREGANIYVMVLRGSKAV